MTFKSKDKDFDPLEIINAVRFCLGKELISERGKNRDKDKEEDEEIELYAPDFDVLKALGLVK